MKRLHITLRIVGLTLIGAGMFGFNKGPNGADDIHALNLIPLPENPEGQSIEQKDIPSFVHEGVDWLVEAQFDNGGWGAGQHARQEIRDPKAVQIDPATTAFAAMALIRTGNTLQEGKHSENLKKALEYLLELVEGSPNDGASISNVVGTQPQAKLGQHIDVSMCAQFFGKILPYAEQDAELKGRIEKALDKCVNKIESAQQADGSWNAGGWAPVLQSAMANSALEQAQVVGRKVDEKVLDKSKGYQRGNVDVASKNVRSEAGAGIPLYAVTANQRANANDAKMAQEAVRVVTDSLRANGVRVDGVDVSGFATADNFVDLGYTRDQAEEMEMAYTQNKVAKEMMKDDQVLAGFGNNGGEEFLSFMMTSESLALEGGSDWDAWYTKMNNLFTKIQNGDGSWSGHHCITSPVFCTAAVIMAMTADRDNGQFKLK